MKEGSCRESLLTITLLVIFHFDLIGRLFNFLQLGLVEIVLRTHYQFKDHATKTRRRDWVFCVWGNFTLVQTLSEYLILSLISCNDKWYLSLMLYNYFISLNEDQSIYFQGKEKLKIKYVLIISILISHFRHFLLIFFASI